MKRSKKAALFLMVPTATLLLAGCGEKTVDAMVYTSPEQCETFSTQAAADQCLVDFKAAQALHPQVAPKYANKAECEVDFGAGNCETAPNQQAGTGSFFMPMMMGYMAAQMLNRGGQAGNSAPPVRSQPLYKSGDDKSTFRTASNTPVARDVGPAAVKPSQVQPRASQVTSRGGFGAQAAKRQAVGG